MDKHPIGPILPMALAFLLWAPGVHADEGAEKGAVTAAKAWLELIDSGKFDESWKTAAALFKGAITEEQWTQTISAARRPLGGVVFRKVTLTQYETSLPGAPDGEYVVIQFETVFENKASAVETVTPMRDPDGLWRVSGYYIR